MHAQLKLVKNFYKNRVVFYWVNLKGKKTSPLMPTFKSAEEWWLKFQFSLYEGDERRITIHDRRKDLGRRKEYESAIQALRTNPVGRRYTDQTEVEVEFDLFQEKIQQFK